MRLLVVFFIVFGLLACGTTGEEPEPFDHPYLHSKTLPRLKIPSNLETPKNNELMPIPDLPDQSSLAVRQLERPPLIAAVKDSLEKDLAESKADTEADTAEVLTQTVSTKPLLSHIKGDELGQQSLVVEAEMDEVWPRIGPAVQRLGFAIEDKSRGMQTYKIYRDVARPEKEPNEDIRKLKGDFDTPEAIKSPLDIALREEYLIKVIPAQDQTIVSVRNKSGDIDGSGLARHLLVQLQYDLEHP